MAKFKLHRHLAVEYIVSRKTWGFVYTCNGNRIEKDAIAYCYYRAIMHVLISKYGDVSHDEIWKIGAIITMFSACPPARDKVSAGQILALESQIHKIAEFVHDEWVKLGILDTAYIGNVRIVM